MVQDGYPDIPAAEGVTQDPATDPAALYTTYICNSDDVFNFAGTQSAQRTNKQATVEGVIVRVVSMIQDYIGRQITPTEETISIHDGRYCNIAGSSIFMKSIFYDINGITSIVENGTTLIEGTDFTVNKPNEIEKMNGRWTSTKLGIVITGSFGMGYTGGFDYDESLMVTDLPYLPHKGMKQIVIEETALKCGLLTRIELDGQGGAFDVKRSELSKSTTEMLKAYIQPLVP